MYKQIFNVARLVGVLALLLVFTGQFAQSNTKAAPTPLDWTPLALKHGWMAYGNSTRPPAAAIDSNNIVHLRGALSNGTEQYAFRLPASLRPQARLYIPVNITNSTGRIVVFPDGYVYVEAPNFADAMDLTSLEGVTFAKDGTSPT